MKNEILIPGVCLLFLLVVAISGCTSSDNSYKSYDGSNVSFEYPSVWTIEHDNLVNDRINNESVQKGFIRFKTNDGEPINVEYGNGIVEHEDYFETEKINNRTYKRLQYNIKWIDTVYLNLAVSENGKDFAVKV